MIEINREYPHKLSRFGRFALLLALSVFSTFALSQQVADHNPAPGVSIGGYSPVSYFTENRAEKGSAEFAVSHDGRTYYLTSAEQVAIYNENPGKYRPRYHYCAYSVSLGRSLPLDPTNFKVIGDTLLLFHVSKKFNGKDAWNSKKESDEVLIERADKQFTLLNF